MKYKKRTSTALKIVIYVVCICLAILSILPFWIMIVNATRTTTPIQQHAISMITSGYMMRNLSILLGKSFNPMVGFMNSLIISAFSTGCAVYFSTMTAYGLVVYDWRLRRPFFSFTIIGIVYLSLFVRSTSGVNKLFQLDTKLNMACVAIAGFMIGMAILLKI